MKNLLLFVCLLVPALASGQSIPTGGCSSGAAQITVPGVGTYGCGVGNIWTLVAPVGPLYPAGPILVNTGAPTNPCTILGERYINTLNDSESYCGPDGTWQATAAGANAVTCVGNPGNTTGAYRQQCQVAGTGAVYACNNSAGCTVAADWVSTGAANAVTTTSTSTQNVAGPFNAPVLSNTFQLEGLVKLFSAGGTYQAAYNSGTTYHLGDLVTYSSLYFIDSNPTPFSGIAPGLIPTPNSDHWLLCDIPVSRPPFTPQAVDVAWAYVAGQAAANNAVYGVKFGSDSGYVTSIGYVLADVSCDWMLQPQGPASVGTRTGVNNLFLHPDCYGTGKQQPYLSLSNFYMDGNGFAAHGATLNGLYNLTLDDDEIFRTIGFDYGLMTGDAAPPSGYTGNNYQIFSRSVTVVPGNGENPKADWANITPPAGGNGTWTINSPGTYLNSNPPGALWIKGMKGCQTNGTITITMSGTGPYSVSSVTSSGFTCTGTLYAVIPDIYPTTNGWINTSTDGHIVDANPTGFNGIANYGYDVHWIHAHPTGSVIGANESGSGNVWVDFYNDSNAIVGLDVYGPGNQFIASGGTWNAAYPGAFDVYLESNLYSSGSSAQPTIFKGHTCENNQLNGGYVLFGSAGGALSYPGSLTGSPYLPPNVSIEDMADCAGGPMWGVTPGKVVEGQIVLVGSGATPTSLTVTPNTTGSATITYAVAARNPDGSHGPLATATQITNSAATPNNTFAWSSANQNLASGFDVYCTAGTACPTTGKLNATPLGPETYTYTDTTGIGDGTTVPGGSLGGSILFNTQFFMGLNASGSNFIICSKSNTGGCSTVYLQVNSGSVTGNNIIASNIAPASGYAFAGTLQAYTTPYVLQGNTPYCFSYGDTTYSYLRLGCQSSSAPTGVAIEVPSGSTYEDALRVTAAAITEPQIGTKYTKTHGANASAGVVSLVAGTATINTTAIAALATAGAGDIVVFDHQTCSNCGVLSVGTVVPGTSFVINSNNASDTSSIYWEIRHLN